MRLEFEEMKKEVLRLQRENAKLKVAKFSADTAITETTKLLRNAEKELEECRKNKFRFIAHDNKLRKPAQERQKTPDAPNQRRYPCPQQANKAV
jgi:hypothetical protein